MGPWLTTLQHIKVDPLGQSLEAFELYTLLTLKFKILLL